MRPTVVAGYEKGGSSRDALTVAAAATRSFRARLLIASAYKPSEGWAGRAGALASLGQALSWRRRDVIAEGVTVPCASPAAGLAALADDEHARLLVIGRGSHAPKALRGPAAALLAHSPVPVAVAPRGIHERGPVGIARVGVAFDGRPESESALAFAATFARRAHLSLTVLMVAEGDPRVAEPLLERALRGLGPEVTSDRRVLSGRTADALSGAIAEEELDLLIVGSRGYGPVRRVLLGSVSTKLVRSCPCPVVVVPRSAQVPDDELTRRVTRAERAAFAGA